MQLPYVGGRLDCLDVGEKISPSGYMPCFALTFKQQLNRSRRNIDPNQLSRVLSTNITAFRSWRWGTDAEDRRGADVIVNRYGGLSPLHVDLKVRTVDPLSQGADDLFIETQSCCEQHTVGWAVDGSKVTDLVVWLFPTGRACVLSFRRLRRAVLRNLGRWRRQYGVRTQETWNRFGGYTSECLLLPRIELERVAGSYVTN